MRPQGCHSTRVLPRISTKAWREATRVSFRMCFAKDFEIRDVPKAWLEAPRVSFHTCFAEDFDNSQGSEGRA